MMDFLGGILGHIATAAAGLVGWEAIKHVRAYIRERKPLKTLYSFEKTSAIWIALSEVRIEADGEFFSKASPIDGVYSTDEITDYLKTIGFKKSNYNIRFSSDLKDDSYRDNLILIGGYENNYASCALRDSYQNLRSFRWENNIIHENDGQASPRHWSIKTVEDRISKDYCLISRLNNPFIRPSDKRTRLIAFEGVRHFGTIGGVQCFNEKLVRLLAHAGTKIGTEDQLELVVSVQVNYIPGGYRIAFDKLEALYVNRERRL